MGKYKVIKIIIGEEKVICTKIKFINYIVIYLI